MWYNELTNMFGVYARKVLAKELNVTQATISYWKSGDKVPSLKNAIRIENLTYGRVKVSDIRPEFNELREL